jgi:hypothetical protein
VRLAKAAHEKANNSTTESPVVTTSSEILPDGSSIELVRSHDGENLALLYWDGKSEFIAPEIPYVGRLYRPPDLHVSLQRAISLASGIADYGSAVALFQQVTGLVEKYIGLPTEDAERVSLWTATAWLADCLPSPPPLVISGSDLNHALKLLRLLCCISPRALMLGELTRSTFGVLPMALRPTLLIAQPELPRRLISLCCSSNYRGAVIAGKGGAVHDLAWPKAFFVGMSETHFEDPTIHLSLPPAPSGLPPLDERAQRETADYILPQLLRYRLDRVQKVRESYSTEPQPKTLTTELARCLTVCVPNEPELRSGLTSILEAEESDRRDREFDDVDAAVVEVLWTKLLDPAGEIRVTTLTDRVNALLQSRGSTLIYKPEEIGWRLRQLGIPRANKRDGKAVRFSRATSVKIHELARTLGLDLSPHPKSCLDCSPTQPIDS